VLTVALGRESGCLRKAVLAKRLGGAAAGPAAASTRLTSALTAKEIARCSRLTSMTSPQYERQRGDREAVLQALSAANRSIAALLSTEGYLRAAGYSRFAA